MRPAHFGGRTLLGRALRAAYAIVLCAIAVVALVVGGTWTLLQSRWGGDLVRRIAVRKVNSAIAGRLAVNRLAFGGNRLTLAGVELRDPAGRMALGIERLEIALSPVALLRGRLETTALSIRRPRVYLVQGRDGLGIGRAFGPRGAAPPPSPPSEPRRRPTIEVRGFSITGGAVEYRRATDGARLRLDDLVVSGSMRVAEAFDLAATVTGPGLDVAGRWTIDLASAGGRSRLEANLRAAVPGTLVEARGTLGSDGYDLTLGLEANDLASTAKALAPLLGGGPRLAGRGRIDATLVGPAGAPTLRLGASAPALTVGEIRIRELHGCAVIPDLRRPSAADLELAADAVRLGTRHLTSPAVSLRATGAHVLGRARVGLPTPVDLVVGGRRERGDLDALAIDRLELVYPEGHWSLSRPAHVRLAAERVSVSGLVLADGAQRLEIDLARRGRTLDGRVGVTALDLARLAPLLAPAGPALGGRLDAEVQLGGSERSPTVEAKLALSGGRVGRLSDLKVDLDAAARGGRLRGQLGAKAIGIAADARFDVPARWPLGRRRDPIDVDLRVGQTDLSSAVPAAAAATDAHLPALRGHVRLNARLSGTSAAPALAFDADARGLVVDDRPVGDVALALRGDGEHPTELRLTASHLAGAADAHANVTARVPLSLRDALDGRTAPRDLAAAALEATADVEAVPLAALARLWPSLPAARGTVSSQVKVSGTAKDPEATATVRVAGASTSRFPPTDADIEVGLERRQTSARLRITRKGHPLLDAQGRLETGWRGLGDRATLAAAPLDLRATIGPLAVRRQGLPTGRLGAESGMLRGSIQANVTVAGTPRSPRLALRAETRDLRIDEAAVGSATIDASYADRKAEIAARLASANGGSLQARMTADADLGGLAVGYPLAFARTPFDLQVNADHFDVRGLSGVVTEVRAMSGVLNASVTGHGTFAAPHVAGRLEWQSGGLTLSGFGQYRDVHLALHGDEQRIALDELTAKSGDGRARLTGTADRAEGGYRLAAQANVSRFLLYTEGQPLGRLSLDATLTGTAAAGKTAITTEVKDAKVELSDGERRDLQRLDMPRDVVLVENGQPKGRDQAEKLRALTARLPGGAQPPAAPAGTAAPSQGRIVIVVKTAERIWVSGKDAKLELAVEPPGLRVVMGEHVHLYGTIVVRRGRVDVIGRRFDVRADSTVRWNGPAERPELDVEAQYDNTNEGISVVVTLKGSPGSMDISIRSPNRPDLTSSQLFALIASGHLEGGTGRSGTEPFSATAEAASLVGGFLAAGLQTSLARRLPLDVLTIDPGSGTSLSGTQVEAGRYVTDRLYVGYVGRIGADPTRYQNRNAVHAEYRLTSRWQLEGEYGDVGTGSADAVWKKNY